MNERKAGILLTYFNISLHTIISFLYIPILLYYIGQKEYGLYQLIGSLIAYFSIMDFGLTKAVISFYSKYKALNNKLQMENILAISLFGYIIVDFIVLIIGLFCYYFLDFIFANSMTLVELEEAKKIFILLLFNILITLGFMIFRAIINSHEKFVFLKGLESIQLILQPFFIIMILEEYPSAFSVALVQTIINVFLIIARTYYCLFKLHINIKFHYWDSVLFKKFKKLALNNFLESIVDQIFWKTNQIILGIVSGTEAVAVYSIASLIYMNYMALSTAISGVYLPHIAEILVGENAIEKLNNLFIQIGRWQYYLLALVASGFIIFGQQFIEKWAGADFEDSYIITIFIILPFTIDLIENIGLSILQVKNKYEYRASSLLFIGIFNIILAIPLAIKYDGVGCAFATGLAIFIESGIIMNWIYIKKIGLKIVEFWKQIFNISRIILICLIFGSLFNYCFYTNNTILFLVKILVYSIFYCCAIYYFSFNQGEKKSVNDIILRFKRSYICNDKRYM